MFSPWGSNVGEPVQAEAGFAFPLHRRIRDVLAQQGVGGESATATWRDPDEDDQPLTTPAPTIASPESPQLEPEPLKPDSTPLLPAFDHSISKEAYHRRERKKRQRQARRAQNQDPEMNRQIKGIATKRAEASIGQSIPPGPPTSTPSLNQSPSLTGSGPSSPDHVHVLGAGEPVVSALSLNMADVNVASTGYMGVLQDITAEDLAADTVESLMKRGFKYYTWDGR